MTSTLPLEEMNGKLNSPAVPTWLTMRMAIQHIEPIAPCITNSRGQLAVDFIIRCPLKPLSILSMFLRSH
jgi:hypothetical protein